MSSFHLADWAGSGAAILTTLAFVPQTVKTLRTRNTRDISLAMWALFCAGVSLWVVYGLLLDIWPVVLANFATLVMAAIVLAVKISNRGKE